MFMNFVVKEPQFYPVIQQGWVVEVRGTAMYRLWQKMRGLQPELRKMSFKNTDLDLKISETRSKLAQVHADMIVDGFNTNLIASEKLYIDELLKLQQTEEEILAQKAKVDWL